MFIANKNNSIENINKLIKKSINQKYINCLNFEY